MNFFTFSRILKGFVLWFFIATLLGCGQDLSSPALSGSKQLPSNTRAYVESVQIARAELNKNPRSVDAQLAFRASLENAEAFFIENVRVRVGDNDISGAEEIVSTGLFAIPESAALGRLQDEIGEIKESQKYYDQAVLALKQGRLEQAEDLAQKSVSSWPANDKAVFLLNTARNALTENQRVLPIRLRSNAPVSLNFKEVPFKEALLALGSAYQLNTIFDADLPNNPISLYAEDVGFEQAFNLILKSNGATFSRQSTNSVIVHQDTETKRAEYAEYYVRTFFLSAMNANEMASLIASNLAVQNMAVSEENNSITIRESRDKLDIISKLINANDRTAAEVVLAVEILEVNRTKSEQLGIDYGTEITLSPPNVTLAEIKDGLGPELNASPVKLPAATLKYLKQDVDAVTLASPRIRTVDDAQAVIHIGDRIPIKTTTTVDGNGQSRTDFDYRDIGIKLTVTPDIVRDNSVKVDMQLEVSSLGQNLGSPNDPSYSIGTRNITTQMILNAEETAIIGGLIRDEERSSTQKIPGIGSIPVVGRLFQLNDRANTRTDILLTLTPVVVRNSDIPDIGDAEIYAGNGNTVTQFKPYEFVTESTTSNPAVIRLDLSGQTVASTVNLASATNVSLLGGSTNSVNGLTTPATTLTASDASSGGGDVTPNASRARLFFADDLFSVGRNEQVQVVINADEIVGGTSGGLLVRFNPKIIEIAEVGPVNSAGLTAEIDNESGLARIMFSDIPNLAGEAVASLAISGKSAGISYLSLSSDNQSSNPLNGQIQYVPSRIRVQ